MPAFSVSWLAILACSVLAACTPAAPERAACTAAPPPQAATSKLRHVPDENDPCQESRGMAPQR